MVCVFDRNEFTRLARALSTGDDDAILTVQKRSSSLRYNPTIVDTDIWLPVRPIAHSVERDLHLSVDQIVDWRMARNFFKNRNSGTTTAQWLLQFSNLLEAIFAVGNLPKSPT